MKKMERCVVYETPPIKVLDKPDKETEVIQNELYVVLMELDKRYRETRARGFELRALEPTEQEKNDKQRRIQVEVMRQAINKRWDQLTNNSNLNEDDCSKSGMLVWNHENDLQTAKHASCFFIYRQPSY